MNMFSDFIDLSDEFREILENNLPEDSDILFYSEYTKWKNSLEQLKYENKNIYKKTNKVEIIGRLCRDAILQYTPNGSVIVRCGIAYNFFKKVNEKWVENPSFFDLEIWGEYAEQIVGKMLKGTELLIKGELKQERWMSEGSTKTKIKIIVKKVLFNEED